MCRVYKRGLRWLNAKELGLNWNGLERDVGASSMLNEERSFSSLEEVTKLLIAAEGKTFRELDETGRGDSAGNKGSLGNIIEESVLHYPVNSDAEADILVGDTRYELKVTPLKHSGKGKRTKTVAKERLVLDIINYENLPKEILKIPGFGISRRTSSWCTTTMTAKTRKPNHAWTAKS